MARVFLLAGRHDDTAYCIRAARRVRPWAPEVPYLQGLLARSKGDTPTALQCFDMCRAIDPGFARCAITLGELHLATAAEAGCQEQALALAEMFLKSAMQYEPDRAEGWYRLVRGRDMCSLLQTLRTGAGVQAAAADAGGGSCAAQGGGAGNHRPGGSVCRAAAARVMHVDGNYRVPVSPS